MKRVLAVLSLVAVAFGLVTVPAPAIVNGDNAATNPGAVSLWTDSPARNRCTGTLVDDEQGGPGTKWVLTAAHCIYSFTAPGAGNVTARIGSTDNTTGYVPIKVVPGQFWYNPAFDVNTLGNDVMLMLLESETPASVQVMKWRKPSLPVGAITQAYGWGWVCDGPAGQSCSTWYMGPLQRMIAKRLANASCATHLDPSQICFGASPDGFTMACLGDSGGPMKSPDFDGSPILRWSIVGDGDDFNGASCTTKPDGTPGLGLAIDIGRPDIQAWMGGVMGGSGSFGTLSALPAPTSRVLSLIG